MSFLENGYLGKNIKMLKTCSICGEIHDFNKFCKRKPTYKLTSESKFRKSYKWSEKSKQIRKRDKYLCQICKSNRYNTINQYNYIELEVHHIVPISEDYSLRLDDTNLITLCRYHHELAERNNISRKELSEIVKEKY